MSLRPFRALVRKDILGFLSDPRAVVLSFVAPVVLAFLFAVALGGSGNGGNGPRSKIDVRLVDEDGSKLSDEITKAISDDENLAAKLTDSGAARQDVRMGNAVVAIVIPKGF